MEATQQTHNDTRAPGYQQRKPYLSPLYAILQDHFEHYVNSYEMRFQKLYGAFRLRLANVVCRFLDCGLFEAGFARLRCPGCACEKLVPFSCKSKLCPSCTEKRVILWAERIAGEVLLPLEHRAFTWTIPKLLRAYFRYDRTLLGKLSRCAYLALRDYYRMVLGEDDVLPGMVAVGQSFGNSIHSHSHCHSIATGGAFRPDGTFLLVRKIDSRFLASLFMDHTFRMLKEEGKINNETIRLILSWSHSGFNVDASVRFHGEDSETAEQIARYIARGPLAIERLSYDREHARVTYRTKQGEIAMDPVEFIGHLLAHVPEPYENAARYYGGYSNHFRHRMWDQGTWEKPGERADCNEKAPGKLPVEEKDAKRPSESWARLIRKIWGENPINCPRCGKTMRLISFISPRQTDVIDRIIDHLQIRTPPRSPPPQFDPFAFTNAPGGRPPSAQHRMEFLTEYHS
jgi:hypothetical protein